MTSAADHLPGGGPTTMTGRAPAPDLARGFMLLLMALAHSYVFLYAGGGYSPGDQFTVLVEQSMISERARPMFFFLFGYGLGQLYLRQQARGEDWGSTRSLLRRRGAAMVLIGVSHVALLFYDVIAAYGVATVLLTGMLRAPDRKLLSISRTLVVATFALYFGIGTVSPPLATTTAVDNPVFGLGTRLLGWSVSLALIGFTLVPAMLLGIWAARRRILEEPGQHRVLLVRVAWIGIGVAFVGGLPKALIDSLLWTEPAGWVKGVAGAVHGTTGLAGGLGAIALISLVVFRYAGRSGALWTERWWGRLNIAIQALGQRSLTFYLFQSVVYVAVFAPFAGGLGGRVGFAGAAVVAVATWVCSAVLAELMRRRDHRGPAELLLRRMAYRR